MEEEESEYVGSAPRCKLWLLICKSASIQFAHPFGTAIMLVAPVLVFLYTQHDQISNKKWPILLPTMKFKEVQIKKPFISSIYYSPESNNAINVIMEKLADAVGCPEVEGYATAKELEKAAQKDDAFVAVEFDDSLGKRSDIPTDLNVAFRFPTNLRYGFLNKRLWPHVLYRSSITYNTSSHDGYEGFLMMQKTFCDILIAELLKVKSTAALIPELGLQPFPHKAYTNYEYLNDLFQSLSYQFVFIFIGPSLIICQQIVAEKERNLREIMRIMGLSTTLNWLSWCIVAFVLFSIPSLIICFLMKLCLCPLSDIVVLMFIYTIYIISLICFIFLICACLNNTLMAIYVSSITLFLSSTLFVIIGAGLKDTEIIVLSFFLNSAMPVILIQIYEYETQGLGIQWNNINKPSRPLSTISVFDIILIMMACNVVQVILGLYVDQLKTAYLGIPHKWYFPFQRKYWCTSWKQTQQKIIEESLRLRNQSNLPLNHSIEEVLHKKRVIIEADGLCKNFGNQAAVRDFSLKFYEDELTVLLGQNGSGKSIIFMMLAGIQTPTSGQVYVNGVNLFKYPHKCHRSISLCPQYNILFEELSSYWHIMFYSRLKGYDRISAEIEAQRYLDIMDLTDRSTIKVKYLSDGMKRKLSVCCALCADTKVVLCDEPAACLDPSSRDEVWNLLNMEKTGRCIVMNTHNMEAAECLGDRVGILYAGKLLGHGTTEFIVNNLGPGYCLVCTRLKKCVVSKVTMFLEKRVEDIELEKSDESEIYYRIHVNHTSKFTNLFRELEDELDNLHLSTFAVRAPTISETFNKIVAQQPGAERKKPDIETVEAWLLSLENKEQKPRNKLWNQWQALMKKQVVYTWNHPNLIIMTLFIPFAYRIGNSVYDIFVHKSMFNINICDVSNYRNPRIVLESLVSRISSQNKLFNDYSTEIALEYKNLAKSMGVRFDVADKRLEEYILDIIVNIREGFDQTFAAGCTFDDGAFTAWFNSHLEHGAAISLCLMYKSIIKTLFAVNLTIYHHPRHSSHAIGILSNPQSASKFPAYILMILCIVNAPFVLLPIQERISQIRHQHFLNSVNGCLYWLSFLAWDIIMYSIMAGAILIVLYEEPAVMLYWFSAMLFLFGLSALCFVYLLSHLFSSPGSALSYMLVINCSVVLLAVHLSDENIEKSVIHYIMLLLPFYNMYNGCEKLISEAEIMTACEIVPPGKCTTYNVCCKHRPEIVRINLIYLGCTAVLYFLCIVLSYYWMGLRYYFKKHKSVCVVESEDQYVKDARGVIDQIAVDESRLKEYSLVCHNVCKTYGHLKVINCLSLYVARGGCFGLLGLNGAGKTTTLGMVVGSHKINSGDIYINGYNSKTHLKYCLEHIGYCPQNNTLMKYMTGRQMLNFFCMIRGIQKNYIPQIVRDLSHSFALENHIDIKVSQYSNGTMRKLNIALAALAPTLICLDEPTNGVDINAKEEIWMVLKCMRQLGKSILITSHDMKECEVLCTFLAILTNGALNCFGSLNKLKQLYNKGILIKIQLATKEELENIRRRLTAEACTLYDRTDDRQSFMGDRDDDELLDSERSTATSYTRSIIQSEGNTKGTQINFSKRTIPSIDPSQRKKINRLVKIPTMQGSDKSARSLQAGSSSTSLIINMVSTREYWELMKFAESVFKADFPDCYIADSNIYRGTMTIAIPDVNLKWSTIFRYMEQQRNFLQIKNYWIGQTTLEDIFLEHSRNEPGKRLEPT